MSDDRRKTIAICHSRALQKLRRLHQDEYTEILKEEYAAAQITVRARLSGTALRESRIAKHKAALESLGSSSEG